MANTALKIHNLSTLYPQLALLPPLKRLQSPLLCSLCAIRAMAALMARRRKNARKNEEF